MKFKQTIATPIGLLSIHRLDSSITDIAIGKPEILSNSVNDPIANKIKKQFSVYFKNSSRGFSLPISVEGTDFQKRVWRALQKIPAGKTLTYGELAKKLHSSPRAVGNACRANPIPIIIPCHRVIAANSLGGFAGKTSGKLLVVKRWLLEHEGVVI